MKDILLTLTGPDRTGLVANLAAIASRHGGNWLDSRMIRLGGTFSGIVRIALPEAGQAAFSGEIGAFLRKEGFHLAVEAIGTAPLAEPGRIAGLLISGQDHPGIVDAIFNACSQAGANVEELSTGLQAAPWSGTPVFEARARLHLPAETSLEDLQAGLENIAADLMVEIEVSA